MSEVERIAGAIAKSGMFGIRDPYAVLTLCLVAQAEGQHPAVVFRDYSIISGKPSKKAEAMLRDFLSAGGKVEWHTLTDQEADATFSHPSGGSARIAWDHERAQKAGLGSNGMYKKYPRQMLRSRVISEGVRTVFPGATSGLYVPEEVAAFEPKDDEAKGNEPDEHIERTPIKGIHAIKKRLRKLMVDGNNATDLQTFEDLVAEYQEELDEIREANHEFWTGDGADNAGYKAWIEFRREELANQPVPREESLAYQLLVSTLDELTSENEYQAWLAKNGDVIGDLDGEESRKFEELHDAKVAELGDA